MYLYFNMTVGDTIVNIRASLIINSVIFEITNITEYFLDA